MPEFRKDPLLGRWVIVARERGERPASLRFENSEEPLAPADDPFSEGNERFTPSEVYALRSAGSVPNGPGWQLRVVPNRYPALRVEGELDPASYGLYDRMNGVGAHEVVIETPDSKLAFADFSLSQISRVLEAYRQRIDDLYRDIRLAHVLVFKNHGREAGATQQYSHSQIIATPMLPLRLREELNSCLQHWRLKRRSLFMDILSEELRMRERLVFENEHVVAFCPYAGYSPFEVMLIPRVQSADFRKASPAQLEAVAEALKTVLAMWRSALGDGAWNFMLHTAPNAASLAAPEEEFPGYESFFCWHLEMFPRLTTSAGFEWGTGMHINPVPPEEAAAALRAAEVAV
ncbi:galactose-1-phosphate uridylyltransferase [bacterium]|nr:galactose-1-phosphate uridylyltransferase [bacterium]